MKTFYRDITVTFSEFTLEGDPYTKADGIIDSDRIFEHLLQHDPVFSVRYHDFISFLEASGKFYTVKPVILKQPYRNDLYRADLVISWDPEKVEISRTRLAGRKKKMPEKCHIDLNEDRKMRLNGMRPEEIAEHYGISRATYFRERKMLKDLAEK